MMRFQFFFASIASIWLINCNAQSIGSFYALTGPTVFSFDRVSGDLFYNIAAENGSYGTMQSIRPQIAPRLDTAIACTGFKLGNSIYASIFYQTTNNSIAQQGVKCAANSGNCVVYSVFNGTINGSSIISANVTIPVKPKTALAAALFSANFGYRVTYEDVQGSMRQLSFSSPKINGVTIVTPWGDGVLTSNSTISKNSTMATAYILNTVNGTDVKPSEQTLYRYADGQILPFIDDNVTFINATANDTWVAAPSVSNLVNFSPDNGTFSTAFYNDWMTIFYIDTGRQLQYVRSTDSGATWQTQPLEKAAIWPLADVPSASVSAAASINATDDSLSVFYISGGKMIQATMTNGGWTPNYIKLASLPASNTTITKPISTLTPYQAPPDDNINRIKIGVSVGAVMTFLLVAGALFWYLTRQKRLAPSTSSSVESFGKWKENESGFSFTGKAELHSDSTQIYELDHDPECLLLHQLQAYRMYEARGEIPVEIEGLRCTGGRAELDHSLCKCEMDAAVLSELPTFCEKSRDEVETEVGDEKGAASVDEAHSNTDMKGGKVKEKELGNEVMDLQGSGFSLKDAVVQLPMWSWAILRQEAEEQGKGLDLNLDLEKGLDLDLKMGEITSMKDGKEVDDGA